MKRTSVMNAIRIAGLTHKIVKNDVRGIQLRRSGYVASNGTSWFKTAVHGTWLEQTWRLQTGGGIAGNGGVWWLTHVAPKEIASKDLGPFQSQRALLKGLRLWRDWEAP